MINKSVVSEYITSLDHRKTFTLGDDIHSPAALPDESLSFLVEMCLELNIKRVFEFGSGRSAKTLLTNGCSIISLEDSDYWMQQTVNTLSNDEKNRHTAFVKPPTKKCLDSFPVLDWSIDDSKLTQLLQEAELILIDSPYYNPFRESALYTSLLLNRSGVIVIDDKRIPTLRHFCERIAKTNPSLTHAHIAVGHRFDVFYKGQDTTIQLNHSLTDTVKGWRRYFLGLKFYNNLRRNG